MMTNSPATLQDNPRSAFARPGYRRAVRIEPQAGIVRTVMEDDLHAMSVELRHDGERVLGVTGTMHRAPWTTCPGAQEVLSRTFEGVALADVTARLDKQANCTHLHDLTVLCVAHAHDDAATEYRIAVTDPDSEQGERVLEVARNGVGVHRWVERNGQLAAPDPVEGLTVLTLRDWIAGLDTPAQEAARLLQWGALVAHGRGMDDARRQAALGHRLSCYTMQPERVADARLLSGILDFSESGRELLAG